MQGPHCSVGTNKGSAMSSLCCGAIAEFNSEEVYFTASQCMCTEGFRFLHHTCVYAEYWNRIGFHIMCDAQLMLIDTPFISDFN